MNAGVVYLCSRYIMPVLLQRAIQSRCKCAHAVDIEEYNRVGRVLKRFLLACPKSRVMSTPMGTLGTQCIHKTQKLSNYILLVCPEKRSRGHSRLEAPRK